MKNILIATDGSESAEQALEVAIDLASEMGAALQVVSVRPPLPVGHTGPSPAVLEVDEEHGAERIAAAAAERARGAGVEATPHVARGDVVDNIVSAVAELGADLLVVGSRGHGAIAGVMLGSVSHALIRQSPVPVTIVRKAPVPATTGA
jgi:nucleotide-binding universal stress UspA family protein